MIRTFVPVLYGTMVEEIKKTCDVLHAGGLILYPTDTIWGIGCDATNESAVQKVYELKQRVDNKAMLVLVDSVTRLSAYVDEVPDMAWELIELSEEPLTLIYPEGKNLAGSLLSEDGSIGIRVTKEMFSQKLCERFRKPLVSTSANISGEPSPANYSEISDEIKKGVDYIVNYRREEKKSAQPSHIIKIWRGGLFQLIR